MAINTPKVIVGGLAAGVVMNVSGFVVQGMLLGKRMEAEMIAVAPTLQGKGMTSGIMVSRVGTQFIIGILLVWLYAAMRPRLSCCQPREVSAMPNGSKNSRRRNSGKAIPLT